MDTEPGCLSDRVNIGAEKKKLPVVFLLLPLNHLLYLFIGVSAAGIFHSVRCDDKNGFFRNIFGTGVLMYVPDVVDGAAEGIQKGCASPDTVLPVRHGSHFMDIRAVIDDLRCVIKKYDGHTCLSILFFLFFDHAVKTADGVGFKSLHGTAPVQDHHEFCQSFFHLEYLLLSSGECIPGEPVSFCFWG